MSRYGAPGGTDSYGIRHPSRATDRLADAIVDAHRSTWSDDLGEPFDAPDAFERELRVELDRRGVRL